MNPTSYRALVSHDIVGWFDHWLMGIPKPEYDVAPQEEVPGKKGSAPGKQPTPHQSK
jgi:hypothetical protein